MGAGDGDPLPALLGPAAGELGLRGIEVAFGQARINPLNEPGLVVGSEPASRPGPM
ncbi:hypothetical protein GCM10011612_13970 [Actinomyces gaoshouyii]|uniref:Uncharacterized protein n=1 Tax=Actinomyces gaoshouyii TaxID=1960083 RepID=A0A8H9LG99_9ACTO|nr:hypothetical protein GCM10011612_13970 [Actinomyces gaoshouyii]